MCAALNIDEEWESFMSKQHFNANDDSDEDVDQLEEYLKQEAADYLSEALINDDSSEAPVATNIYISTKTKIAYLNVPIDLSIFWDIVVINYYDAKNGVVKKQIKLNLTSNEEIESIQEKLKHEKYYEENVITHIDNPTGRIKFKDARVINIGINKKDIMSYRCKEKRAFYNCFVLIVRMKIDKVFKEFHVKIFNTGKVEIPGIKDADILEIVLKEAINVIQPYVSTPLYYKPDRETILINSNFNCGFFINREVFYEILKFKYNIQASYDPCSYPGIQCRFYYNPDVGIQNGCQISTENVHLYKNVKKVSFMIFRTGSVLIVGKCDENVLMIIYEFLKIILNNEYKHICQKASSSSIQPKSVLSKIKSKKIRRKTIYVDSAL